MSRPSRFAILALLAGAGGCNDRTPEPTAPEAPAPAAPAGREAGTGHPVAERQAQVRLARRVALALADPAFRSYVKQELDRSPVAEHKVHFQRWLTSSDRHALKALAKAARESEAAVDAD